MKATLILTGANVLTMNPAQPKAEAIAIKKDKILKVGSQKETDLLIGKQTKILNLKGKTVVPGFIDTHIHIVDYAKVLTWLDLNDAKSIEDLKSTVQNRTEKLASEKWVIGRGWNQNCFKEKRLPNRADLDQISPNNPAILYHQCEQMCVVNSKMLALAGITNRTIAPKNGVLDKDDKGELTGILRGEATNLVWEKMPEADENELSETVRLAFGMILKAGITSVHWIILSPLEIFVLKKLWQENKLPLRIYLIVPVNLMDNLIASGLTQASDGMLRVGGALIFTDGYLASRTAALLQPYSDALAEQGKLLCSKTDLIKAAEKIREAGFQLIIHAVGDKAVDNALTAIETLPQKPSRVRLEQAAVLNEKLIGRMNAHNVLVSVQPQVVASEFNVWSAINHIGSERAKWLFPLKTLLRNGVKVVGGSDCPMEPLNPLVGIQAAVTRESFPEQRVTVEEALRMYTVDAAFSSFEEDAKGSIEAGKQADLAVISSDPTDVPTDKIQDINVEMTIVSGQVVQPQL